MSSGRGIASKTGVPVEDLVLDRVAGGWGDMADFSIARETLLHQADVAAAGGRRQVAENFRRAAELVGVPDDMILRIYDALRPFRATPSELATLAAQLRLQFHAPECARWVEEAAEVYASRGLLRTVESAGP
ncbi:MAG: diol dehydratase small subunit [Acidobacteriia bacterium]|nr:diol dehydratase small subunit [Terriglobia bacterium]